jgi:hypothetical protein
MPDRIEVDEYGLVVSAVDHGLYWQGSVHIFAPDRSYVRTIDAATRHATMAEAESAAGVLGAEYVRGLQCAHA